jgi:ketosteroid isomerase-like protein
LIGSSLGHFDAAEDRSQLEQGVSPVKMKIRTALLLVVIPSAFVATSCAPSATSDSRAADASAIQALDEQWSATAARNDLEGTVAFYADDAVLLPPNAPIATDRKSIRESWAGLLGPNTAVSWKVSKVEVAKSGELGYLYGTYSLSIQDPKGGPPVRDTGKLVEIWKKQVDGKWKCIVDTYNSDLSAAPAPEAKK